jgi:hypothetical protein
VVALLVLGDLLLTLGGEGCLKVWSIGSYDAPQVSWSWGLRGMGRQAAGCSIQQHAD